jgi:HD-like signal output (HDOD) protein
MSTSALEVSSSTVVSETDSQALEHITQRFLEDIHNELTNERFLCPSLPEVAMKVQKALEDPHISVQDIARVVATDPSLSAQLIRIANSAFYGDAAPVSDLRRAVVRIGNDTVQHVIMLLVVAQLYNVRGRPLLRKQLLRAWHHSTLVATISDYLATSTSLRKDVALLAGLIHDIGELPLLVRAEHVPQIFSDQILLDAVLARLRGKVGRAVLQRWRFPPELVAVVSENEDLLRDPAPKPDYVDLVLAAHLISDANTDRPLARVDWAKVPATQKVGLRPEIASEILEVAGSRVASLRNLLGNL